MIIPWLSGCVHEVIMLDRYWTLICGWTRLRLCGCAGALSRTRRTLKTRCLYIRYNFHTSIYWHSLLALHSTYEWQPFCHFVFSRSKSWWHRQKVFAHDELASVKHLIILHFSWQQKLLIPLHCDDIYMHCLFQWPTYLYHHFFLLTDYVPFNFILLR